MVWSRWSPSGSDLPGPLWIPVLLQSHAHLTTRNFQKCTHSPFSLALGFLVRTLRAFVSSNWNPSASAGLAGVWPIAPLAQGKANAGPQATGPSLTPSQPSGGAPSFHRRGNRLAGGRTGTETYVCPPTIFRPLRSSLRAKVNLAQRGLSEVGQAPALSEGTF